MGVAEDVDADQANDGGNSVAINFEVVEGAVLDGEACVLIAGYGVDDIHGGAHGKFVEQAGWDRVSALRIGEGEENGIVVGLTLLHAVQCGEPGVELEAAFIEDEGGVVGDIVAAAHEGVDGAQGFALALGQDQKGVVEIFGVGAGDTAAYRIRHLELRRGGSPRDQDLLCSCAHSNFPRAARATSASLRGLEITGRRPSTAKFWRSMAFRISWPPRVKSSMSTAKSLSTFSTSGRPRSNHWRARPSFNFLLLPKEG